MPQCINNEDLLKLLKINPSHPLYKSFMDGSQVSEQGVSPITNMHLFYTCVCVLGFLTTLLLSLPQLASLQQTTVNVGTQVDAPAEEFTYRKYLYHTE